ncbi:hypothetical protein PG994_014880 [Apiospora phragmitis]|uniref:Uncharacterized protein n=1 Tax=Apiospora phragmitis TaxID=2905665 RepID=A0ABR1SUV3_9PEZI
MESNQLMKVEPQEGTWGYYNLLPDELKLKVLQHAIPRHGAHHFTMKVRDGDGNLVNRQVLDIVSPLLDARKIQDDDSAWLNIWNIGWTVGMSRDLIVKAGNRKVICTRERSKFWAKKEGPNKARHNPNRDLIILRVASKDFEITDLDPAKNRKKFRDIKRVGIDFFSPEGKARRGTPWSMGAFYCVCRGRPHKDLAVCPQALCDFLRLFSGLREVFIIYPINKGRIDQREQQGIYQRGQKRSRDGEVIEQAPKFVNKPVDALMDDTINKFKGLALEQNLAIFEDRKKVYYQVRKKYCTEFKDHKNIWGIVKEFRDSWRGHRPVGDSITTAQWAAWTKVKVGVLVCRDRVGNDPWKVNAILNNEIEPEQG